MEKPMISQERERPSLKTSPKATTGSNCSSSSNNSNADCNSITTTSSNHDHYQQPTLPPLTRSENPYPTTFIQADTSSFKKVVQMLTGSTETATKPTIVVSPPPPKLSTAPGPKKQAFKLYERRHSSFKNLKMISPLVPGVGMFSTKQPPPSEILSPSILDLPSLVLSPVTPLAHDPFFNRNPPPLSSSSSSSASASPSEEQRAMAEKGYYLHPSPRTTTPRDSEPPRLLPLFPLTSPSTEGA